MNQLLDALVDICGPDYARAARSVDAVGGRRAGFVAVPATVHAVADVLRLAADRGLVAVARGSGSKIDWGPPKAAVDLIVDTARLGGMWHHDVAGRTAEVGTGTPVHALQAALALRGQRLPVDPPSRTATVGGMLAVNESGPLRHRFGSPAEWVERMAYVDELGQPAESDGERGRPGLAEVAGVITSAAVRLEPLPALRRWVTTPVLNPIQATKLATSVPDRAAAAIETDLPAEGAGALAVLFEGDEAVVTAESDGLADAWGADAAVSPVAPAWWGRYPFAPSDVALRLSTSPADLPATVYALADAAGMPISVRGSAGLGSVHAVLPGTFPPERINQIMETLRHVLMARNGQAVLISAPPTLATEIELAARHDFF
ncbi:FAD-binding oxidoreductase [Paractinoplanes rishiriensis]|uniref:Glycolate oxidase n=1 Tax=Paractinoplanes rishiriensis TaxID=1050105 RepID=A0A919K2C4_9ACTN|nr:FAD-binding oxidoreductase [Actinoplanes rishiriensis]GIE98159.1 glycolate oxidase [Actinoplanes rishiriensis]